MKKLLLLSLLSLLMVQNSIAQNNPHEIPPSEENYQQTTKPQLKDRIFVGGDLGLSFGSLTYVNIAPIVGYRFTPKFSGGLGPSYSYYKDNRYPGYEYSSYTYGARFFAQYRIIEQIMAYSEYNIVNAEVFDDFTYAYSRVNLNSLLLGGGYVSSMGPNSSFNLMVLFNVLEDQYSYYQNPIIRVGVNVGL